MSDPKHGIYLNFPEAEYHKLTGHLSKSLIHKAMVSPADAYSAIYDDYKEPTDYMIYGSALHKLVLEGREKFDAEYCKGFDKKDFPKALDIVADLKKWLDDNKIEYPKSSTKPKLIQAIMQSVIDGEKPEIMDVLKHDHDIKSKGKTQISADDYDEISSREWLAENYDFGDNRFTEVSFFWLDEELQCECKARLDLVSFPANGNLIWDLKSFDNSRGMNVQRRVRHEFDNRDYCVDAAFYERALINTPMVFHDSEKPESWPDEITKCEFNILFIEKTKYPNVIPKYVQLNDGMGGRDDLGVYADGLVKENAKMINYFRKEYGKEKPWNPIGEIEPIGIEAIPAYKFD